MVCSDFRLCGTKNKMTIATLMRIVLSRMEMRFITDIAESLISQNVADSWMLTLRILQIRCREDLPLKISHGLTCLA